MSKLKELDPVSISFCLRTLAHNLHQKYKIREGEIAELVGEFEVALEDELDHIIGRGHGKT